MTRNPRPEPAEIPARPPCEHDWTDFVGQSGMRIWKCTRCDIRRLTKDGSAEETARQRAQDGKNKRLDPG
jgi:hypothetical protein